MNKTAKDMFLDLDLIYKEDNRFAYLFEKNDDGTERMLYQLEKDHKCVVNSLIYIEKTDDDLVPVIDLYDLRAIIKFYQELGVDFANDELFTNDKKEVLENE